MFEGFSFKCKYFVWFFLEDYGFRLIGNKLLYIGESSGVFNILLSVCLELYGF